jgi:anthranilate phosphoribosyltransferase
MNSFQESLKKIIDNLTKALLDGLINEDIDRDEAQEMASYILEEKKKVIDEAAFTAFLTNLKNKYSFFVAIIESFEKEKQRKKEDDQKIEAIKNQLLKFT